LLAGPSGSANRVVFPPVLRFSIVKARAEGMAQALTAQETAIATAAQRRCVDPIIAIPPREPAYFLEPFVWPQKLFSSRAVRFSEGVAVQPRGVAVAAINARAGLLAGGLFGFRFLRDFAVMGRSTAGAGYKVF
jgi:hypothetical protein